MSKMTAEKAKPVPPWPPAPTIPTPTAAFNGRLDAILAVLNDIYKSTVGSVYWSWKPPTLPLTLRSKSELELLTVEKGSPTASLAKITMPDNTPPQIFFVAKILDLATGTVKRSIIGKDPYELVSLGFSAPNTIAYTTIYDNTAYTYAWVQLWKINITSQEALTLTIRNETAKDATVQNIYVEGTHRPEGKYTSRL
jgi:hypothetical protein